MNLNYINLYTSYRYGLVKSHMDSEYMNDIKANYECKRSIRAHGACFYLFFKNYPNNFLSDCTFEIDVNTTLKGNKNSNDNNYSFLTRDELVEYLDYLTTIVNFGYRIEFNKDDCVIKITSTKNTHFANKWILSSIRNVYEYPQSWALKEAIELKKIGYFKDDDNIINAVNAVLKSMVSYYREQYVCFLSNESGPKKLTTNEVKENIGKIECEYDSELNDIYPNYDYSDKFKNFLDRNVSGFNNFTRKEVGLYEGREDDANLFDPKALEFKYKLFYKKIYNDQ